MDIIELPVKAIKPYAKNPRKNDKAVEYVANSIRQFGFKVPIVIDSNYEIVCGHTRWKAAKTIGLESVPCVMADDLTPEQVKAFRLADNKTAEMAGWDFDLLEQEFNDIDPELFDMSDFGFFADDGAENLPAEAVSKGSLAERFLIPPLSVLDARSGVWNARKKLWKTLLNDVGEARPTAEAYSGFKHLDNSFATQVSIFDPVLAEVLFSWFSPQDTKKVFDVFAGGAAIGFVSSYLGGEFTGIELRQEQCDYNQKQIDDHGLNARYICDDGRNVLAHIAEGSQDLLFSCPPYYDLEVYSDSDKDASNQKTYEEFYAILDTAYSAAAKALRNNRFAIVVASDIRSKKGGGGYYDFVSDIKKTFANAGFSIYNEMILLTAIGTTARVAGNYMKYRKVGRVHQEVLIFYKGDTKRIPEIFGEVEVADIETETE